MKDYETRDAQVLDIMEGIFISTQKNSMQVSKIEIIYFRKYGRIGKTDLQNSLTRLKRKRKVLNVSKGWWELT